MNIPISGNVIKNVRPGEAAMVDAIKVGAVYEHVSGKRYRVLSLARNSDNLELCVIYQALEAASGCQLWVKSLQDFTEMIAIDGCSVPRFKPISMQAQLA